MFPALGRRPSEGTREPRTLFVRLHQGGPRTSHICTNIVRMDPRAPNLPHSDGAPFPVRTDRGYFCTPARSLSVSQDLEWPMHEFLPDEDRRAPNSAVRPDRSGDRERPAHTCTNSARGRTPETPALAQILFGRGSGNPKFLHSNGVHPRALRPGGANLPRLHDGSRGDPESPRLARIPSGRIPGDPESPYLPELHGFRPDIYTGGPRIS